MANTSTSPQDRKRKQTKKGVTKSSEWKKSNTTRELELPSGNVCLARNPGMQSFITQGLIPNSLMPIVQKGIDAAEKGEDAQALVEEELEPTPEVLNTILECVDLITIHCVVEPKVLAAPSSEEDRDEELLYVDEVDLADKFFIFQWAVGGTSDLESFREQSPELMATLSTVQGLG